jgi:hypothetical protein
MQFKERFIQAMGDKTIQEVSEYLEVSMVTIRKWLSGECEPNTILANNVIRDLVGTAVPPTSEHWIPCFAVETLWAGNYCMYEPKTGKVRNMNQDEANALSK